MINEIKGDGEPKAKIPHILVVDDDSEIASLYHYILSSSGYEVDMAFNGAQAKYKVENNPYDLVITDLNMPLINGAEFIKVIKHRAKTENLPVIVISGFITMTIEEALTRAGVSATLHKPVDKKTLISTIKSVL